MSARITPQEVVDAYRKTGVKFRKGGFAVKRDGIGYCCPLAVLCLAAGNNVFADSFSVGDWAIEKYGRDYQRAFWLAIDMRGLGSGEDVLGINDALKVMERLKQEGIA